MPKRRDLPCPCDSGQLFTACCESLLMRRTEALTAEQLMRSRYTAYARHDAAHLRRSWHPDTRPDHLDFDPHLQWTHLSILRTERGDPEDDLGVVEFRAEARWNGTPTVMHEVSRFERVSGRWVYVDGDVQEAGAART